MAIIKPEQLRSGSYSISGSFSGSFQGDGSDLTNVTASFIPVGLGGIYGGNGTVPLNTTASINGDFTFQGLDEDTRLIVRDGNNGSAIHLFSDGPSGQSGVEFRTQTTDSLLHRIQIAGGDTRYQANQRDLVFSTSTSSLSSGIFITASNGNVGIGTVIPNYKLDVVGTGNISEDLFVRDTIYVGNVTGTPITNASLYIRQPSITGSSESPIIDIQVDDANSYFRINNATATDGFFTPSIITRQSDSPDRLSLFFDALVEDAQDTPGAADVMRFRARRDTPDFIQNRNLYAWYNYTTRLMDLDKDGNLRLFQGGLTVNGNTTITGSVDVLNGNVNITSNAYFFQGTDTGGTNVSLIGVNSSDQIYIGNQGFTNIIADSTIISGSLNVTAGITGSYTGSFIGDGNGLFNIPASGIVGLNLSQIVSGSVSASISPDSGLQINTNVTATSFTGSLSGTASFAQTASYVETAQTSSYVLQAVSSSFASSGTGEFTGSFSGSFVGDGSQLTGIISSKWSGSNPITRDSDVEITGSFNVKGQTTLFTTGSGTLTVQGSGSAQPLFLVTGSIGELISVIDQDDPNSPLLIVSGSAGQLFVVENSITGSLLQIYDSSSNSVFEVNNDAEIVYGVSSSILSTQYLTIPVTASYQTIYNIATGSFTGAFVNYTATSASNARAGQLMSVWNSGTASYTETTTTDIGDTTQIAFDVIMTGSVAQLSVSASLTTGWQVKTTLNIL